MLLYSVIRPFAKLSFYAFYRKIYLSNTDRIPRNKPVILASNHPTAFLEPCILACFLPQPLNFLVRGDLFLHPFYNRVMRSLNLLPVFRLKDAGYGKIKSNYETFATCYKALADNKTIMILAEGRTKQTKRLGALQKGSARIALDTIEKMDAAEEVYVVPVGVNFTYADKARSEVMIDFGHPLLASDYRAAYEENANSAITEMTQDLYEQLKPCMVIIDDEKDDVLVEYLLQVFRTGQDRTSPPLVSKSREAFKMEQELAASVNQMEAEQKTSLLQACEDYFEHLQQFGLDDRAVGGKDFATTSVLLQLLFGFPFQLVGKWWNYLPDYLGRKVAREKVKQLEFKAPVRWGVGLGTGILYHLILLIVALIIGSWTWVLVPVMLLLGYFHLHYRELKKRYQKSRRLKEIPEQQRHKLVQKRAALISLYNNTL
jgi:1-acyl-sn-glycerol-3-phosphate acyltransferase